MTNGCPADAVCFPTRSAVLLATWVYRATAWQLDAWAACGPVRP